MSAVDRSSAPVPLVRRPALLVLFALLLYPLLSFNGIVLLWIERSRAGSSGFRQTALMTVYGLCLLLLVVLPFSYRWFDSFLRTNRRWVVVAALAWGGVSLAHALIEPGYRFATGNSLPSFLLIVGLGFHLHGSSLRRSMASRSAGLTKGAGIILPVFTVGLALFSLIWFVRQADRSLTLGYLSPDSWSYYEISKTIFSDFGRIATHRQHFIESDYNLSFPPLYPLLIAVVDRLAGLAIYCNLVVAWLSGLLCLLPLWFLAGTWTANRPERLAWTVLLWSLLLFNPYFMDDLQAGRSLPTTMCLLVGLLTLWLGTDQWTVRRGLALGALAGATCLLRFDFSLAALVLALLLFLVAKGNRWLVTAVYSLTVATFVSPWIIYSLHHFGVFCATDNSFVSSAASAIHVRDYYPQGVATMHTAFAAWIARLGQNLSGLFKAFNQSWQVPLTGSALMLSVYLVLLVFLERLSRPLSISVPGDAAGRRVVRRLFIFLPVLAAIAVGNVLTGYFYGRYFVFALLTLFVLVSVVARRLAAKHPEQPVRLVVLLLLLIATFASGFHTFRLFSASPDLPDSPPDFSSCAVCIDQDSRVFSSMIGFIFGAQTGVSTYVAPANWEKLSTFEKHEFLAARRISFFMGSKADARRLLPNLPLTPIPDCPGLYRIVGSAEP